MKCNYIISGRQEAGTGGRRQEARGRRPEAGGGRREAGKLEALL
jgi:hypothetical protein